MIILGRGISLHVGLRSSVRLDVRILRSEKLLSAISRQIFDDVGELAPTVVTLAGIALSVLIRKYRSGGFQHCLTHKIF
jgi:hypothetical protein